MQDNQIREILQLVQVGVLQVENVSAVSFLLGDKHSLVLAVNFKIYL